MRFTDAEQNALRDVTAISTRLVEGSSRRSNCPARAVQFESSTADRIRVSESIWRDRAYGRRSIELARLVKAGLVS